MTRIIITDLTRFSNRKLLCTAGIDTDTGDCIRPMPYFDADKCKELKMLPGAILTGTFSKPDILKAPHTENMNYQRLKFKGYCSSEEFREVLANSASQSIEHGFGVLLGHGQKLIPREEAPARSIITIGVDPKAVRIVPDGYNASKIKVHVTDSSGKEYPFLSITDLGLHSYAENHYREAGNYAEVNRLIHSQKEVFVRIGLGQYYEAPDGRAGFWMQANGIYSFPEYFETARRYE